MTLVEKIKNLGWFNQILKLKEILLEMVDSGGGVDAYTKTESDNKYVTKVGGMGLSENDYSTADKDKLTGIATDATKNDTDANLKNRANHTGSQAISTVTGLQAALDAKLTSTSAVDTVTNGAVVKRTATGQIAGATPVGNTDLANKKYVDDAIAAAIAELP